MWETESPGVHRFKSPRERPGCSRACGRPRLPGCTGSSCSASDWVSLVQLPRGPRPHGHPARSASGHSGDRVSRGTL
eukprot:7767321-Alexandrium_andersonii.AAC.1